MIPRPDIVRLSGVLVVALLSTSALPTQAGEVLDQDGNSRAWRGAEIEHHTVIDFAASWCAPCLKSLPKLEALAAVTPEIDFLVVSVDDEVGGRDELVERLDLSLPVVWDADYVVAEHYEPTAMPATYLVAPGGETLYSYTGSGEQEWLELVSRVEALAAEASETDSETDGSE